MLFVIDSRVFVEGCVVLVLYGRNKAVQFPAELVKASVQTFVEFFAYASNFGSSRNVM